MYWAVACATRRTLPNVKSSATMPRQPSVPNLIGVGTGLKVTGLAGTVERGDDLVQAGQMTRGVPGHLVDEYPCAPGEPGDVPVVAAGLVEPPRRLEVRLLDEPVDAAGASRPRPRGVEIAESSGRKPGLQS